MSYLININEDLDEQVQEQIRRFRKSSKGTDYRGWYRIQAAIARAHDTEIYHDTIENFVMPNLFDESGDAVAWYHWRDPQQKQVNMVKRNLKVTSSPSRMRGRVNSQRLKAIFKEILAFRVNEYLNPQENMEKLKIMCIIGGSGCGKTLASLHLKYKLDANVICSFTTRPPRPTEVEGRDHHFIDIVPDRTEMIAYAHFAGNYYYALKTQVFGPCTVYVIDEKGLKNLKTDFGDIYDIYTVFVKRDKILRRRCGVSDTRIARDRSRELNENDYDFVIENNGTKADFFKQIDSIYNSIKNNEYKK